MVEVTYDPTITHIDIEWPRMHIALFDSGEIRIYDWSNDYRIYIRPEDADIMVREHKNRKTGICNGL